MPEKAASISRGLRLIVAGGGTGGHLFPGIAVAEAFTARAAANRVLFLNAGRPLEKQVLSRLGWPQEAIGIEGIKGRGPWKQFKAALRVPVAMLQAMWKIRVFKPDAILGVGGYSAGPVVASGWLLGIPTAVHEQNRLPGITNRILGRIAKRVYVSFAESSAYFPAQKTILSGNPVRRDFLAGPAQAPVPPKPEGGFTLLILGGSQGAQAINQAVAEALPLLKDQTGLRFIHQTGPQDEAWLRQAYAQAGAQAEVKAFFNVMAARYRQADLIVCRAGATTVAELTSLGRPAVFVPFPFAADDHQTRNAQALVDAGAAEMIPQAALTGETLARKILALAGDRARLTDMAAKARALGRPEAAETIVDDLYRSVLAGPADNLGPRDPAESTDPS